MKKVAVIGAGFGGLALAIRLQSAGVDTVLIEARDKPGGRAYYWERDGFTFDAGPTVITDPDCAGELWRLSGHDIRGCDAGPGLALLPAHLARRHQFRLFQRRSAAECRDRQARSRGHRRLCALPRIFRGRSIAKAM
jgi:phytoene dehydrogenase-like protein